MAARRKAAPKAGESKALKAKFTGPKAGVRHMHVSATRKLIARTLQESHGKSSAERSAILSKGIDTLHQQKSITTLPDTLREQNRGLKTLQRAQSREARSQQRKAAPKSESKAAPKAGAAYERRMGAFGYDPGTRAALDTRRQVADVLKSVHAEKSPTKKLMLLEKAHHAIGGAREHSPEHGRELVRATQTLDRVGARTMVRATKAPKPPAMRAPQAGSAEAQAAHKAAGGKGGSGSQRSVARAHVAEALKKAHAEPDPHKKRAILQNAARSPKLYSKAPAGASKELARLAANTPTAEGGKGLKTLQRARAKVNRMLQKGKKGGQFYIGEGGTKHYVGKHG